MPVDQDATRAAVCRVMEVLYNAGLAATGGNVSGRLSDAAFVITPAGASADRLGKLGPRDLVTASVRTGEWCGERASSETEVHRAVYAAWPGCGGVVHAHPLHTLALGPQLDEWPMVSLSSRWFTGSVFVTQSALAGSELARAVRALSLDQSGAGRSRYGLAIIVPDHGVFAASRSVERALYFLNKIEENARLAILRRLVRE